MSSWWSLLVSDVHCVLQRDPAARNLLEAWTIYPGVHAIAHHRIAHALWTRGWRYLPRWISFVSRCVSTKTSTLLFCSAPQFSPGCQQHKIAKLLPLVM